jgi:hypothetical protein
MFMPLDRTVNVKLDQPLLVKLVSAQIIRLQIELRETQDSDFSIFRNMKISNLERKIESHVNLKEHLVTQLMTERLTGES